MLLSKAKFLCKGNLTVFTLRLEETAFKINNEFVKNVPIKPSRFRV